MNTVKQYSENLQYTKTNNVIEMADKKAKWQVMLNAMNDNNLSDGAVRLFFQIYGLVDKEGFCFAPNQFFCEKLNIAERTLRERLQELENNHYIKRDGTGKNRRIYIYPPGNRPGGILPDKTSNYSAEFCQIPGGVLYPNPAEFCRSGHIKKKEEKIEDIKPQVLNFEKGEIQEAEKVCITSSNCTKIPNKVPAAAAVRINSLDPFLLKMQLDDFMKAYDYKNISNPVNPRVLYKEFHNVMSANELTEDGEFVDCEFLCTKAKEYRKSIDSVEFQRRPDNWLKDGDYLVKRQLKKEQFVRGQVPEQKQPEPKLEEIKNLYKGVPPEIKQKMNNLFNKKSMSVNVQNEDVDREKALEELNSRQIIRRKQG